MLNFYGYFDFFTNNGGTITNYYGGYVSNPGGAGIITNAYGYFAEQITRGSTLNYAFFSAGTTHSKFTGGIEGTTTNDNACAGCVGEYVESVIATGSAVVLTTGTAKTITSISLTAGDWDVDCVVQYTTATTTSVTGTGASLSLATNTLDTTIGRFVNAQFPAFVPGASSAAYGVAVPPLRFSLASTTSIFMVGFANFTVAAFNGFGIIRARRVR